MTIRLASSLCRYFVLHGSEGCCVLLILLLVLISVPAATAQTTPYSVKDIEKFANQGTEEHGFLESVKRHGINFAPTLDVIKELKANHVTDSVMKEILAQHYCPVNLQGAGCKY